MLALDINLKGLSGIGDSLLEEILTIRLFKARDWRAQERIGELKRQRERRERELREQAYRESGKVSVALYRVSRYYGGPEEGGWWFDTGSDPVFTREFSSDDECIEYLDRLERVGNWLNKRYRLRSLSSVLADFQYRACVLNGPARCWPAFHPHYE